MRAELLACLRQAVPPFLWAMGKATWRQFFPQSRECEQPRHWYDRTYKHENYRVHYTKSRYYFLWSLLIDRIRRAHIRAILDIGCGPGQFAALLHDQGIQHYVGIDFSHSAIRLAKRACPEFTFREENALTTTAFDQNSYDGVVCTEFLEHVDDDLLVLARIRTGTHFFGTVPNFPGTAHVRYFETPEEVCARYSSLFREFQVDAFPGDATGKTYYVMEGKKT